MARPLRIELPDALYHVMARGNRRAPIYVDNQDRQAFLDLLDRLHERFGWLFQAYCLMGNHYHLLLRTPEPNLSKGMRQLNGIYTQAFNRRHRKVGHLFQGRYTAHLVEESSYLLELSRYIVLNPVRARMVKGPRLYPWSSYLATIGQAVAPRWLDVGRILEQFGKQRLEAITKYKAFVRVGIDSTENLSEPKLSLYYGSDDFVARTTRQLQLPESIEIRKVHRREARPLAWYSERYSRNEAIRQAWRTCAYTQKEIGAHFGLHYASISRIVNADEDV